jgi:hypothetical protein
MNSKFSFELGYNSKMGGSHGRHSDIMREKMKGRKSSYENIKEANKINVGRIYSNEHCFNISNNKISSGKKMSGEEKKKISEGVIRAFKEGRHIKNKIPKNETEIIKSLYLLGTMNKKQLSIKYGVSPTSIDRFLKKQGV